MTSTTTLRHNGVSADALADAFAVAIRDVPWDRERVRVVHAPGRVNLIGEHTDYNEGFVLPAAINLGISIALLPTDDRRVTLTLAATDETASFHLDRLMPTSRTGGWIDYVAGMAWALEERSVRTRGFRGLLFSDLPQGSGLSSSAALELASAFALTGGETPPLDPLTLAQTAQRAENAYVGINCGLMDQFASTFGEPGKALLFDCRTLAHRAVTLPLADVAVVACHSGSPRRLQASAYNERRRQCEAAVAGIARSRPGVHALRDVTPEVLEENRDTLDTVAFDRAAHVVHENLRVLDTVAALEAGDLATVGRLFAESQASMRDQFGISSPELEALVAIATGVPGVIGARLTGAGFGGCTINLVHREALDALRAAVVRDYPARTGLTPRVFEVEPARGVGRIDG